MSNTSKPLYEYSPQTYSVKPDKTSVSHPLFGDDFISKAESEMNLWDKLPFLREGKGIQEMLRQMFPGGGTKLQYKNGNPIPKGRNKRKRKYKLVPPLYFPDEYTPKINPKPYEQTPKDLMEEERFYMKEDFGRMLRNILPGIFNKPQWLKSE